MRTTDTKQDTALAALDRATHVRVKIDDADGTPQDVTNLVGEDFLDQVVIDAQTDVPISAATIRLFREVNGHSLSPLRTDSEVNRDSSGAYAAFLNPNRDVTIEVATLITGETPVSGDWVLIWEGIIDEVDWGGTESVCRVHCRDPMARLNDWFIETTAEYGNDGNYLSLPGESGDTASTPDAAALDITGDLDIRIDFAPDDWTGNYMVFSKYVASGNQKSWYLGLRFTEIRFKHSTTGSNNVVTVSTEHPGFTDGDRHSLRVTVDVDNGAGGFDVTFYTGDELAGWVQLGSVVTTATATSFFSSTAPVVIGGDEDSQTPVSGKVYRAQIYDGIDGTLVFDADFTAEAPGTTSFTESSSNAATVTINQSGDPQAEIVLGSEGTEDVEDVMQDILTAEISSPAVTLAFTATGFPVRAYDLGNVTVLDALQALADLIGWNLHWRWNASAGAFRLTLWQPDRSNTTADYTFGTDDYYVIPSVGLDLEGIRNKGEVVYLTTGGTVGTATDERTVSVGLYSTRFIRIDARETSVVTSTQATNMLDAILDDLEEPAVQQQIETAFWWPLELGDLLAFSANEHYDSAQKLAVFGYRHVLGRDSRRTIITTSGKPSGGYERWHNLETGGGGDTRPSGPGGGGNNKGSRPPAVSVTFDANGQAVVSATGDETTANMYVTVGDGTAPADPTATTKDGTITGRSGTVSTTKKITTGNAAYVRVIAVDYDGKTSMVGAVQHARRVGQFHKDTSTRTITADTTLTTLETITVPGGVLGTNGGFRLTSYWQITGTNDTKTLAQKVGSSGTFWSNVFTAGESGQLVVETLMFNDSADNVQEGVSVATLEQVSPEITGTTQAEDTSADMDITFTAQLANGSDSVELKITHLELIGTD